MPLGVAQGRRRGAVRGQHALHHPLDPVTTAGGERFVILMAPPSFIPIETPLNGEGGGAAE